MKHLHIILAIFAFASASSQRAYSLTADDLARYLGVASFSTTVQLPSQSFVAEVWTIKDGSPEKRLIEGQNAWNKSPEKGITIMIGAENGKYKIAMLYGSGVTMSVRSDISLFGNTISENFPTLIKEGNFPLFGKPAKSSYSPRDIRAYQQGFLLRITKKG